MQDASKMDTEDFEKRLVNIASDLMTVALQLQRRRVALLPLDKPCPVLTLVRCADPTIHSENQIGGLCNDVIIKPDDEGD